LDMGLVNGLDRRARELELAARLERDRPAAGDVAEPDDVLPLHDRLPAEEVAHAVEQRADAARAVVGHRLVTGEREGEFVVLGADAEPLPRLVARLEPRDKLVSGLDRRHVDLVTGHAVSVGERAATIHKGAVAPQSMGCIATSQTRVRSESAL